MSAIFKTDSGIFNSLQANQVSITGQVIISGQPVATENYVINTVQGGVDYSSQINTISGNLDTATGNIDQISGAVEQLVNSEIADDTAFNTISGNLDTATGNIDQISGVVQNLSETSSSYSNSDLETYLNGRLETHIIPSGNSIYDIGSAENKIRHLYLSNNSLYIGNTSISATEQGEIVFPSGVDASGINISGPIGGVEPSQENNSIQWNSLEKKWIAGDKVTNLENNLTTTTGHLYSFYKEQDNIISNVSGSFNKLSFQNYTAPASSNSIGIKGEITYDDYYMYICVSENSWKRIPLSDF